MTWHKGQKTLGNLTPRTRRSKQSEMRELRNYNREKLHSDWREWDVDKHNRKHLEQGPYWLCPKCRHDLNAKTLNHDLMISFLAAEGLVPSFEGLILEDKDDSPQLRISTRKFRKLIRKMAKANGMDQHIIYYARHDIRNLYELERDIKLYLAQKYCR